MYLIHYLFIVWLQYVLLTAALPAIAKAAIVFAGTLLASWSASAALRRVPACAQIIGAARRAPTARLSPAAVPTPSEGLARRLVGPGGTLP